MVSWIENPTFWLALTDSIILLTVLFRSCYHSNETKNNTMACRGLTLLFWRFNYCLVCFVDWKTEEACILAHYCLVCFIKWKRIKQACHRGFFFAWNKLLKPCILGLLKKTAHYCLVCFIKWKRIKQPCHRSFFLPWNKLLEACILGLLKKKSHITVWFVSLNEKESSKRAIVAFFEWNILLEACRGLGTVL